MHRHLVHPRIIHHIHTRTLIDLTGILIIQDHSRMAAILRIITLSHIRIRTRTLNTRIPIIPIISQAVVVQVQPRCLSSHIRKIHRDHPSNLHTIIIPTYIITIILMDGVFMAGRVQDLLCRRLVRLVRTWGEDLLYLRKVVRQDMTLRWTE